MATTNDTRKDSPFRLLRQISIANATAFIAATVLLAIIWHHEASDRAINVAEQQSVHLAELMLNALRAGSAPQPNLGLESPFAENQFNRASFDKTIRALARDTSILKVKLFSPDGIAMYSSRAEEIGQRESRTGEVQRTFEKGAPSSHYSKRTQFQGFGGPLKDVDIVETYMPYISSSGKSLGVFEFY